MIGAPGKYYVYAVVDKAATPATVLAIRLSRQEANDARRSFEGPTLLSTTIRVRRAKLTLFET